MGTIAGLSSMGKRGKGRPKTSERRDRPVKVDSIIVGWAEWIAKSRGMSVAEYLSSVLREPVERDFAFLMQQYKGKGKP